MTDKQKRLAAHEVCRRWENDWGGLKGERQPTAKELIRALCASGWYGRNRSIGELTNLDHVLHGDGWFSGSRPAKVKVHQGGMSMISEAGSERMDCLDRARRLISRYQRFRRYMEHDRHNWQFVCSVGYADNSIEHEYRSQLTGEIRRQMAVAPHGDVCF